MVERNEKGQLMKGAILNPEGRPVGTRNFQTDFDEVVEEIAKANNITNSEARKILIKKAYGEAKDGNFQYYKDIVERVYGKVPDNLNVGGNLVINIEKEVAEKYANTEPEINSEGQPPIQSS